VELIWQGVIKAVELLFGGDREIWAITWLSLKISGGATLISLVLGIPLGIALALLRFPGRGVIAALVNTGMGLPPVVVGLLISIALWRSGPLGFLEMICNCSASARLNCKPSGSSAKKRGCRCWRPSWQDLAA
jgi:tungstate transport system permease protein